ncbi:hypothetical protein JTE90_028766 [Oedothorax gibbosus]|uniref:Uncharacterized protein n=1 Tax=Oedothorax gibbosus TaxID=931172 RepID=A0AAV6VYA6_9ARAC|nr:hypothetical protein JTE90_028766 [Oedothorax gibbosus]
MELSSEIMIDPTDSMKKSKNATFVPCPKNVSPTVLHRIHIKFQQYGCKGQQPADVASDLLNSYKFLNTS